MAPAAFKDMIVSTNAADIVYTAAISGVHGNFLKPSIDATGAQIDLSASTKQLSLDHETRAWKNVWSAGQGVGSIDDCPTTAELCARLVREYREAMSEAAADISRAAPRRHLMQETKERVALTSIVASGGLTVAKGVVGVLSGSLALISEAAHSALDFAATVMTWYAVRVSGKPADEEHHYGHGKVESVTALIETGLLFVLSAFVILEAANA